MKDIINARCGWAGTDELYIKYHDEEWGRPVSDDKTLFEFLVLESAPGGVSLLTILRKREGYRRAFHGFDVEKVARMTAEDVVNNVKRYARNGSIITFHDSLKSIEKLKTALPQAIEWLMEQGYEFKTFE